MNRITFSSSRKELVKVAGMLMDRDPGSSQRLIGQWLTNNMGFLKTLLFKLFRLSSIVKEAQMQRLPFLKARVKAIMDPQALSGFNKIKMVKARLGKEEAYESWRKLWHGPSQGNETKLYKEVARDLPAIAKAVQDLTVYGV